MMLPHFLGLHFEMQKQCLLSIWQLRKQRPAVTNGRKVNHVLAELIVLAPHPALLNYHNTTITACHRSKTRFWLVCFSMRPSASAIS